jgi:hypothetical protein
LLSGLWHWISDAAAFFDQHNGTVAATGTIFIAIFTVVLAVITRRQADLTRIAADAARRSALVAERALTQLERPYVIVEVTDPAIQVGDQTKDGFVFSTGIASWQIVNHGRTPAILIDRLTAWRVEAGERMPNAIDPITQPGLPFPAGCAATNRLPYREATDLWEESAIQTLYGNPERLNHHIFFVGYIRYADFVGGHYIGGFCLKFDWRFGRFVRIGDERYNYDRAEKYGHSRAR